MCVSMSVCRIVGYLSTSINIINITLLTQMERDRQTKQNKRYLNILYLFIHLLILDMFLKSWV